MNYLITHYRQFYIPGIKRPCFPGREYELKADVTLYASNFSNNNFSNKGQNLEISSRSLVKLFFSTNVFETNYADCGHLFHTHPCRHPKSMHNHHIQPLQARDFFCSLFPEVQEFILLLPEICGKEAFGFFPLTITMFASSGEESNTSQQNTETLHNSRIQEMNYHNQFQQTEKESQKTHIAKPLGELPSQLLG